MTNPLSDRHAALMEKSLALKEEIMDKYGARVKGNMDENSIKAFVALSDSLENNITKQAKLQLMKEKNEIDRANGGGMAELFKQIQAEKILRHKQEMENPTEPDYKPQGLEIDSGELVTGEDSMDYDKFMESRR